MYPQVCAGLPGLCVATLVIAVGVFKVIYGGWRLWRDDPSLAYLLVVAMGIAAIVTPCQVLHELAKERRATRAKLCKGDSEVAAHMRLVQEHLEALEAIRLARARLDTEAALRMNRIREDTKWLDKNYRMQKDKGDKE